MTTEEMETVDKLIEPGIPMGGQIGRYAHWLVKLRKRVQEVEAERDAANRRAAEDMAACIEAERRVDAVMNVMAAASGHDQESVEEVVRAAGAKIEELRTQVFMLEAERDDARRDLTNLRDWLRGFSAALDLSADDIGCRDGFVTTGVVAARLREYAKELRGAATEATDE